MQSLSVHRITYVILQFLTWTPTFVLKDSTSHAPLDARIPLYSWHRSCCALAKQLAIAEISACLVDAAEFSLHASRRGSTGE